MILLLEQIPHIHDFEICLYRTDGGVSVITSVYAFSIEDANRQAMGMLNNHIAYAIVWQGIAEVGTAHRDRPN
jgi:hypothetical protein